MKIEPHCLYDARKKIYDGSHIWQFLIKGEVHERWMDVDGIKGAGLITNG